MSLKDEKISNKVDKMGSVTKLYKIFFFPIKAEDLPPKYEEVVVTTQIDRPPQVHQPQQQQIHQQRQSHY